MYNNNTHYNGASTSYNAFRWAMKIGSNLKEHESIYQKSGSKFKSNIGT